jgi:hypothetical protein
MTTRYTGIILSRAIYLPSISYGDLMVVEREYHMDDWYLPKPPRSLFGTHKNNNKRPSCCTPLYFRMILLVVVLDVVVFGPSRRRQDPYYY